MSTRWFCRDADRFAWRSWDDEEFLLYDQLSGSTHIFDPFVAGLLQILQQQALSIPQLTSRCAAEIECWADAELQAVVEQTVARFDQLGLVEPLS